MVARVRLTGSAPGSSGSTEARLRLIAAVILVLALGVRIGEVQRTPYKPINDAVSYLQLAQQAADTGDYLAHDPGAGGSRGPSAYFAPGYPYFLGLVDVLDGQNKVTGGAVEPARLANAVLGTITVALIGLIALELFGPIIALIALAIASIYPPLVELSGVLVAENLLVAFELAAVWTALRSFSDIVGTGWIVATGVFVGLATLTHSNAILLAIPLGIGLSRLPGIGHHRRVHAPLAMLAALVATLAPWLIRDRVVMHQWVPITDESGITLAGTYNPTSAAASPPYKWRIYTDVKADHDIARIAGTLSETQLSSQLLSRALSYIGKHPASPLDVAFNNTRRLLELEGSPAWRASAASIGLNGGTAQIGVIGFWLIAALALAGAFTQLARSVPGWVWGVPVLMWLSVILVNAETPRFREAIDPFLIILAACALGTWLYPRLAVWLRARSTSGEAGVKFGPAKAHDGEAGAKTGVSSPFASPA
jgi:Dolichyl-phosphate-mannose-protein mannosyltransferase